MLSSYPSCNIHLILKFYVGNKYILEQYLQEFRWVSHQSGGVEWGGRGGEGGTWNPVFHERWGLISLFFNISKTAIWGCSQNTPVFLNY